MKPDTRHPWYALDVFVFVAINVALLGWLWADAGWALERVTPLGVVIAGLAVYRCADIIAMEEVTAFLRAPFKCETQGFKGFMAGLICCPSCAGVWVAMAAAYGYLMAPRLALPVLLLLALSACERFCAKIYALLEAAAEGRKK